VRATKRSRASHPWNGGGGGGGGARASGTLTTATATATAAATRRSRWNSSFAPRHGKGVEPDAGWEAELEEQEDLQQQEQEVQKQQQAQEEGAEPDKTEATKAAKLEADGSIEKKNSGYGELPAAAAAAAAAAVQQQQSSASKALLPTAGSTSNEAQASESPLPSSSGSGEEERAQQAKRAARHSGPLDVVLDLKTPQDDSTQGQGQGQGRGQQRSMSPPPYVHQFDSYSLVKQLQEGGYTQEQAITSMKGIRALLGQHLDVALASLVSKSDVENETYLFRAACSELHQEIKNNRRLQDEQMRQQRTHLQHEVDILAQSLNQEVAALNDQTRGMFNDRRMAVREEQKTQDSAVCLFFRLPILPDLPTDTPPRSSRSITR
jgi:hypothetical protein